VDGSFNNITKRFGYGGFLVHKEKSIDENGEEHITEKKFVIQGSSNDKNMASMRNVAGEIMGSQKAIELAIENGYKELAILYDYTGVEFWATGRWKTTKPGTRKYQEYCKRVLSSHKIKLHFIKVKGHSGIPGNEEADILAKESCGITLPENYKKAILEDGLTLPAFLEE
jgi:ribonuclease HI